MVGRRLAVWSLVFVSGCASQIGPGDGGADSGSDSGPPAPSSAFTSGTRLRAHVWDGGDGAKSFLYWYDTQLDAPCLFTTASDGEWRCLPETYNAFVYADASCSQNAIAKYDPACGYGQTLDWAYGPATTTGNGWIPGACGSNRAGTVYHATAQIPGATQYYELFNGVCTAIAGPANFSLYEAESVPDASFARATLGTEGHGARLAASVLTTDDGTRAVIGPFDVMRNEGCWPLGDYLALDDLRCTPTNVAWKAGGYFTDGTCSTQVAYTGAGCTPEVILSDDEQVGMCGGIAPHVYDVAGPAAGTTYVGWNMACMPDTDSNHSYWRIGPLAADGAYPSLTHVEQGAGRLRARWAGTPDAAMIPTNGASFHDTAAGADCRPVKFADAVRCVDTRIPQLSVGAYADPQCTVPIAQVYPGTSECPVAQPARGLVAVQSTGCSISYALFTVGAQHNGNFYALDSGNCHPATLDVSYLYVDVTPQDPSEYAVLTEVTE